MFSSWPKKRMKVGRRGIIGPVTTSEETRKPRQKKCKSQVDNWGDISTGDKWGDKEAVSQNTNQPSSHREERPPLAFSSLQNSNIQHSDQRPPPSRQVSALASAPASAPASPVSYARRRAPRLRARLPSAPHRAPRLRARLGAIPRYEPEQFQHVPSPSVSSPRRVRSIESERRPQLF